MKTIGGLCVAALLAVVGCGGSDETNAGAGNMAGAAGGSAVNGTKPVGPVLYCFGDCPLGECDNDGFWSDAACTDVYQQPLNASSALCAPAHAGGYCLEIGTDKFNFDNPQFAVNCDASGVASVARCATGCGRSGNGPAECTQ